MCECYYNSHRGLYDNITIVCQSASTVQILIPHKDSHPAQHRRDLVAACSTPGVSHQRDLTGWDRKIAVVGMTDILYATVIASNTYTPKSPST